MAKQTKANYLTAGELELLRVLWTEGPVTIAEVQRALDRPIAYPTVQTRLNRLVGKRLALRTKTLPGKYKPLVAPGDVGARHLDILIERVAGGSVMPLVTHLLKDREFSLEEVRELKRLLAAAEQSAKQAGPKEKSV